MGFVSLHAYDADVNIPAFKGLAKSPTEVNGDLRYAEEAYNVETFNGVLQPRAVNGKETGSDYTYHGYNDGHMQMLAILHRRWYEGTGSKDWFVMAADGYIYVKQKGVNESWMRLEMPDGITRFTNNKWSWVTYETTSPDNPVPVDVLLMSNKDDGLIMVTPPDRMRTWNDLKSFNWGTVGEEDWQDVKTARWTITVVDTGGYRFGIIERYVERLFGADVSQYLEDEGIWVDRPDRLVYSAPFNPEDWEQNEDIPEDGAGEVDQPSWDGDRFTALAVFGDQLLAFKEHRIWRVMGTNPGEYAFKEQYGEGAPLPNTVAVDAERVLMADENGISVYDGMTVRPFWREYTDNIWKNISKENFAYMYATVHNNRYYITIPRRSYGYEYAASLLVLDFTEGTTLMHNVFDGTNLLATDDGVYYVDNGASSGSYIGIIRHDAWDNGNAYGWNRWITPWIDFSYKRIVKGGFEVYFTPEVKDQAVTLRFSIQTEKKLKTKDYTIQPLTEEQKLAGKEHRVKRLHFGGSGRKFRLIIEANNQYKPWRLTGGIQIVAETDPD